MKTIDRIKADPRVDQVWNEGEDGWWVLLKSGYICAENGCCAVHEFTLKTLWDSFRTVQPESKP